MRAAIRKGLMGLIGVGALCLAGVVHSSEDAKAPEPSDARSKAEWAKRVFTGKEQFLEDASQHVIDRIQWSGFGTSAVTHSNNREADYRGNLVQPNGVGRSGTVMYGLDTKAGIQAIVPLTEHITATVQVVSDHRADNSYAPEVEWANVKYAVGEDWYVRLGRVVAQPFTISDYRNVGYAITMVRPPYDLYSLTPLSRMDGGEIGAQFMIGDGRLNAQLSSGRKDEKIFVPGIATMSVNGTSTIASLLYDIGYSSYRVGVARNVALTTGAVIDDYWNFVQQLGPSMGYPPENVNVRLRGSRTVMLDLGYSYDPGPWLVQGEMVLTRSDSVMIQDQNAWYVMAGYRLGKWTPYVAYSDITSKQGPPKNAAACRAPFNTLAACTQHQYQAFFINLYDARANMHVANSTATIGARYDVAPNVDIKFQFDRVYKPAGPVSNVGVFSHYCQPADGLCDRPAWGQTAQTVNLMTFAVDFVF